MQRSFLALLLAILVAAPAFAGTAADPEITDGNDASLNGGPSGCLPVEPGLTGSCQGPFGFANIQSAWVAAETEDRITLLIDGPNNPNSYGPTEFRFHFTVGGTDYMAGIHMAASGTGIGDGAVTPIGIASSARFTEDTPITMEVVFPRVEIGTPSVGTVLTGLYVDSELNGGDADTATVTDRAPDSGSGRDYVLTLGPSAGPAVGNDTDDDGLDDAWEQQYFGDLDALGSEDPDGDNLTNAAEQTHGTDPTDADTDGDGYSDGDEVLVENTDPTDAGSFPGSPRDDDGDGLDDTWEQDHFGNLDQNATGDPDVDECDNACEYGAGSDPNNFDTDDDSFTDGYEVASGSDPLDPASNPNNVDADGDGCDNACESTYGTDPAVADTDGDGVNDGDEILAGTDPTVSDAGNGSGNASSERDPVLSSPAFLTTVAEGLGLDSAFGDYAEVVLLALLVLLVIALVVLLIVLLTRRGPLAVSIEPRRLEVTPGTTAEFRVAVRNRKKTERGVQARFETGTGWKAGLALQADDGASMEPLSTPGRTAGLKLFGKGDAGDRADGFLRVQVPADLPMEATADLDVIITPLDADGAPDERHARSATARIVAAPTSGAPSAQLKIAEVVHEPEAPTEGQRVTTKCLVENHGDAPARVRMVLNVDDAAVKEETIEVQPHTGVRISFPWTAGGGRNRVKVQVFPA